METYSLSRCCTKDKETKALKYTITGLPDAPSIWRTKEKKIENNYPPTFPWEQQHKPRHPHIWVSQHSVLHTARGGDCPTNVAVRAVTSQIFCCVAPSGQWFNSRPCRAVSEGPTDIPARPQWKRGAVHVHTAVQADSSIQPLCASPLHLHTSN